MKISTLIQMLDMISFIIGSLSTIWLMVVFKLLSLLKRDNNLNKKMIINGKIDDHEIDITITNK